MKRILFLFSALFFVAVTVSAKKVKVTIDGTVSPSQTTLYLIVNEDTAHAQLLPIVDGHFSVTLKVDSNDFIRLHDWKEWPERAAFVLIPDSRHITVNWRDGSIEGSKMSKKLKEVCREIQNKSPEGFHIDVFSDDPEAWKEAHETGNRIRQQMLMEQRETILRSVKENRDNVIPAWIVFCYYNLLDEHFKHEVDATLGMWQKHPILKLLR
ncbi:MAG: hypothetical protein IKX36_03700 [Prevotella sp.]|nr:hypothetical protein [Prevotella sp.]